MSTTQVNFRRGTSSQVAAFTPSTGELVIDLTNHRPVIGDAVTLGGFTGALLTDVNTAISNLSGYVNTVAGGGAGIPILSGNLTTTGQILYNDIIGLSGTLNHNDAINLSGNLAQSGAALIAKDLAISGVLQNEINNISGSYIFSTTVISGISQQFIQFPPTGGLGNNPFILCTLTNISGAENIIVQPSGASSSGYWAQYSNIIDGSGYLLTTLATTSSLSMATNIFIISGAGGGASTGNYLPSSINFNTLIDWAASNTFYITLTGNTNFTFANSRDGQTIIASVSNTGTGPYSGIWPSTIKWPVQTVPVQTTGNFTDIYTFIDITGAIYGSAVQGF